MTIRSDRTGFGPLFDAADSTAPVDVRTVSTVAPQALFLLNHPFAKAQAVAFADRILKARIDRRRASRPRASDRLRACSLRRGTETRPRLPRGRKGAEGGVGGLVPSPDPVQRVRGDRMTIWPSQPPARALHVRQRLRPARPREPAASESRERRRPARGPQAAPCRRRPSGSSSCSCPAGRRTSTCSTPSRSSTEYDGKPLPFEQPKLVRTKTGTCSPSPLKFAKHGAVRDRGQRAVPAPREHASTTSASSARWSPTTSTTTAPACR